MFTYFENEPEPKDPESFTREDVDGLIQAEQSKFQTERSKMAQQLEEIQKTSSLNEQQKGELEEQVTALREASMTIEERAKAALDRKEQDFDEKFKSLEAERGVWEDRYTKTRIRNSLLSAANGNELKPFHSDDICNALGPNTYLKEITDELGKKTGDYAVRIKFSDVDKEGKTTLVDIEPSQAVAKMSKMPRWEHLFQSGKTSGTGGSASVTGTEVDLDKLAKTDTKKFLEITNANPELLN